MISDSQVRSGGADLVQTFHLTSMIYEPVVALSDGIFQGLGLVLCLTCFFPLEMQGTIPCARLYACLELTIEQRAGHRKRLQAGKM